MKESLFVKCGIVVSVILLFATIAQGAIKPISLTCEYMDNPTTVDVLSPRLSWINQAIPSSIRGEYQKAYRICVASSREKLLNGKADVWDTGKVNATDSYLIPFKGKSLESGKDYWWRVMVWDNKDKPSIWSNVAHWGMGLLFPSEWKAKWIGSSWRGTAPLLRKSFMVRKEVASAKAFVTGLGYFEFYLNGKRVGDDYLVPNFTTSTDREGLKTGYISIDTKFKNYRVLYLSYDVTHQLQVNRQNVIGAILGNGFYDINCSWTLPFGPVRFYCQLEITYKDGTKDIVCSDESWKAKRSPIVMNGIYDGEIYDANKEVSDWSSSQCDDSDWENVVLRETPTGKMTAQTSPSDKITEVLHPLSIKKQDNGKYLVSFGKQISGWVHLRNIHGQKGDTLDVHYICEYKLGVEKYIFNGSEKQSYAPRFTWYSFSDVEITGLKDLTADMITAEAINTDVRLCAKFKTSNALFNKINEIWQRSQMDNMHGCIASDCPTRERSAYLGDGQVSCVTVMHNFDAAAFYQKWIRDARDIQNTETGFVPNAAPYQPACGGGIAWGAAMNIMPWEFYLQYGDKKMLQDNYFAMKEQVRYMRTWLTKDGTMFSQRKTLDGHENIWYNLGDWASPYELPSVELVHTFYLWRCADYTARAAKILNKMQEYEYYSKMADEVKKAFNDKFYDKEKKTYGDNGSNVFALVMGVPSERYNDVVNTLRDEIVNKYKGHLNTGIFGTQFLFETLALNGMSDVAYEAMNKRDFPSYGLWIEKGATTTWEQWKCTDSHNHPMFGGGLIWFYRELAGVNADENEAGYKHIIIKPYLTEKLSDVYYSYMTPYGKLVSEVKQHNGTLTMNVTIPVGSYATVYIPVKSGNAVVLESGKMICNSSKNIIKVGEEDGYRMYKVYQGGYSFTVKQ